MSKIYWRRPDEEPPTDLRVKASDARWHAGVFGAIASGSGMISYVSFCETVTTDGLASMFFHLVGVGCMAACGITGYYALRLAYVAASLYARIPRL